MEPVVANQHLKALLLGAAGLFLAIVLGWKIGTADYGLLTFGVVGVAGICFAFFSGRFFWVVTIASASLAGTFPILGGSFTPFNVLMVVGVGKFLIEDMILRRTKLRTGNRFDLIMICGFMAILTIHALHDRFGMRFLGSTVWGGRNYVNVFVGLAAFVVIQSIPMNPRLWSKLPYVILAVATFDLIIALVTTIFPGTIYKIYPFYSAVSRTGIEEIITGDIADTARLGAVGNFGVILISLVLASTSLRRLFHPSNIFRIFITGLGAIAVLLSSFRTAVFNALAVILVAGFRDFKLRSLLFVPAVAAILFGLSLVNSEFVRLPKPVQRSLTFVPGKWDPEMQRDAAASNEWRVEVWNIWEHEFFPVHPLLGRGFGFNSEWAEASVNRWDPDANRQMVEVGNVHNGFFAALDTFGIIGTIFFVIWNLSLLVRALRVPFGESANGATVLRFVALSLGASIICYWLSAQNVGAFLPQEFAIAAVFLRLRENVQLKPHSLSSRRDSRKIDLQSRLVASGT